VRSCAAYSSPLAAMASRAKDKVLIVCHNHPAIRPGGAEAYAHQVYEGLQTAGEFDATFIARSGPPVSITARTHEGRPVTLVTDDPNQYFFYTDLGDWEWTFGRSPNKSALTRFFRDFLLDQRPDIVHFQHTMFLGYDVLRVTRNTLPDVPIVYTLHEFLPICFADGKMLRTFNHEPCTEASPRRCHECFPLISQQTFFMRERFIKSHLSLVDLFIVPSEFALERYADWGIPRSKLHYEPHGNLPATMIDDFDDPRPRNRFGFFGQLSQYKGVDVLLRAMALLGEEDLGAQLWIHGSNLDWAPEDFQEELHDLLDAAGDAVTIGGRYEPDELRSLMAGIDWVVMPSIWWENAPLVIQEAFQYGRPVICSDIGGMAEKVANGVSGLHFRTRDSDDLAETMKRAIRTKGLWRRLRLGAPDVRSMDDHVAELGSIYSALITERRSAPRGSRKVLQHV
jgi:glycosyltransferase involved in cell wall biosynthesis